MASLRGATRQRGLTAATAGLIFLLAACGSEVAPEDFYGAGSGVASTGAVAGNGAVAGAPGTVVGGDGTVTGTDGTGGTVVGGGGTVTGGGTTGGTEGTAGTEGTKGTKGTASGAGGGTAGGGTSGGGTSGGGAAAPPKGASCDGFKNGTGVTDDTITIATAADISGPAPKIFQSAHDGINAFVAYFNSVSSICGRKLKVQALDTGTSAAGNAETSRAACKSAFAQVGSMSGFDSGGAGDTEACGLPDLRAQATEEARQTAATTFAVSPIDSAHFYLYPWQWAKAKFGAPAVKKSAFVYLNVGAASTIAKKVIAGTKSLGYDWVEVIPVDITGVPNWNAYANQIKASGVQFVQTILATYTPKLQAALRQAGYVVPFMADASTYDPSYATGDTGAILKDTYAYIQTSMLEDSTKIPEIALYKTWLANTGGGAPTTVGLESWAAGRLFTDLALKLGGKLTRESLIAELKQVKGYNGHGALTPADIGAKTTLKCLNIAQNTGTGFARANKFPYECGPLT